MGQDRVSGGVGDLYWLAASVEMFYAMLYSILKECHMYLFKI